MAPPDPELHELADGHVLHLLGGPYLTVHGVRLEIPECAKRLVSFVALRRQRVERRLAAGTLWPAVTEARAAGNLRSALWRLRTAGIHIVLGGQSALYMAADVTIDTEVLIDHSTRLLNGSATEADLAVSHAWLDGLDLLPGWYDDWALLERERLRQRTLHTLEVLSGILSRSGRFAEAVDAALIAVSADPLRERPNATNRRPPHRRQRVGGLYGVRQLRGARPRRTRHDALGSTTRDALGRAGRRTERQTSASPPPHPAPGVVARYEGAAHRR